MPEHPSVTDYSVSRAAEQDLKDIYVYSYQMFGEDQAERYTRDLHARFALIAEFPGIGLPTRLGKIVCLKFPTGSHVIYYRRIDDGILIGRILHAAQDPTRQTFNNQS